MSVAEKMTAIADAIREKTGGTELLTLDRMAAEIAGIQTGSGVNPLDHARSIYYAFNATAFGGIDFSVVFGAKVSSLTANAFYGAFMSASGLNTVSVACACPDPGGSTLQQMFRGCEADTIDISGLGVSITGLDRTFNGCSVKTIIGEIDTSAATVMTAPFNACANLETIRFKSGSIPLSISFANSPNLTDESIQSIIDGLADLTGGTAQTLTLHATVGAKLTDEQKATASAKNWTLSY